MSDQNQAPAVSEAMREAVARHFDRSAFLPAHQTGNYWLSRRCDAYDKASAILALDGPIASEIARLTGERDAACDRAEKLLVEGKEWRDMYRAASDWRSENEPVLRAAEAALSRLQADRDAEVGKLRALSDAAAPGEWSVSGVRSRVDEPSCVIINAPSCPGLMALPTSHGDKALEALHDAKFAVAAVNFVRAALTSQEKTDV